MKAIVVNINKVRMFTYVANLTRGELPDSCQQPVPIAVREIMELGDFQDLFPLNAGASMLKIPEELALLVLDRTEAALDFSRYAVTVKDPYPPNVEIRARGALDQYGDCVIHPVQPVQGWLLAPGQWSVKTLRKYDKTYPDMVKTARLGYTVLAQLRDFIVLQEYNGSLQGWAVGSFNPNLRNSRLFRMENLKPVSLAREDCESIPKESNDALVRNPSFFFNTGDLVWDAEWGGGKLLLAYTPTNEAVKWVPGRDGIHPDTHLVGSRNRRDGQKYASEVKEMLKRRNVRLPLELGLNVYDMAPYPTNSEHHLRVWNKYLAEA